jgi:hypothetical protein
VKLYHATHKGNLDSIFAYGLLLRFAKCTPTRIWAGRWRWRQVGLAHVCRRHDWAPEDCCWVGIECRAGLFRHSRNWLYYVAADLPAVMIRGVYYPEKGLYA